MINKLSGNLQHSMAHYEHSHSNPTQWRAQLAQMDIICDECQCSDEHPHQYSTNEYNENHTFGDGMYSRAASEGTIMYSGYKGDFLS